MHNLQHGWNRACRGEEVYGTVIEIAKNGWNGEYFENLRPARHSPVAGDPGAGKKLAELTGMMLKRLEF